jgi:hypothetical protein
MEGRTMIDQVTLRWMGPYFWFSDQGPTILTGPDADTAGVYVWCVPFRHTNLIHYVGQTEAGFAKRHYEHFREYMSGRYTVNRAEAFRRGVLERLYTVRAYARAPWRRAQPFFDQFGMLSQETLGMLRSMVVFLAPLEAPRRIHRRVEAAIVSLLYKSEPPEQRFQEPGMRVHSRRIDEPPISVDSTPPGLLHGLPHHFEA